MSKTNSAIAPKFYREHPYAPGWYIFDEKSDPDSKYFRYQIVPTDTQHYRDYDWAEPWDYSIEDERQADFKRLISAGVLSREAAEYIERYYVYRYNIFVVGGENAVRRALLQAIVNSNPSRNVVSFVDESEVTNSLDIHPYGDERWEKVKGLVTSRNDVLLYDGVAPSVDLRSALLHYAGLHVVVAGFESDNGLSMNESIVKNLRRPLNNHLSLTIRLGDFERSDGRVMNGVTEIEIYENYHSGNDKGVRWRRLRDELVQIPSTIVY